MILAESGDVRIEASPNALLIHAPGPPSAWPSEWLSDLRWWRLVRELVCLEEPFRVDYGDFDGLLREGLRLPLLFADWSPFTIAVSADRPPRFLLGEIDVEVERVGRYVRRRGDRRLWLLDKPSWKMLEAPDGNFAALRDLAVEANGRLCRRLAERQIVFTDGAPRTYATRRGWIEERHVDEWDIPVTPLAGRVGLRAGLPVRIPAAGRLLMSDAYDRASAPCLPAESLSGMLRKEIQAVVAATFVWRGYRVVLPADASWMEECVLAVRDDEVTVVAIVDFFGKDTIRRVHEATARFRRLCPGRYHARIVARSAVSQQDRKAADRVGIRLRDLYELANTVAGEMIPKAAVPWILRARCGSPGESAERLQEARMLK